MTAVMITPAQVKGADPAAEWEEDFPEVPEGMPRHKGDGRPKVWTPDGSGKSAYYTRASKFGAAAEDKYLLTLWKMRAVLYGASRDWSIVELAAAVEAFEDKGLTDEARERNAKLRDELNGLVTKALAVTDTQRRARRGTALHVLAEQEDAGKSLPHVIGETRRALDAYHRLMSPFEILSAEQFVVCDEWGVGGSYDRLVTVRRPIEVRIPDPKRKGELKVVAVIEPGDRLIVDLKGLALDTPIPTPDGWTTMGAVQVGDQVFGSDGKPCTVTAKSRTKRIGTYVVKFSDGAQIVCDREHLWWVLTGRGQRHGLREQVLGVETLRDTLFRYGQRQHRVPVARPLDLPNLDLPVAPYLLGAWIGDGRSASGMLTADDDLFGILRADGYELGNPQRKSSTSVTDRTVIGLRTGLRTLGLLGHKAIPDIYLRASIEQRVALLQGLMDTDGSWNRARGRATFYSTVKALAEQVRELCASLGLNAQFNSYPVTGYGVTTTAYAVEFRPIGFVPFRLPRKADQVELCSGRRAKYRTVYSVEPGPDVETACIAVDSANSTYLCGDAMIPTHNSNRTDRYFGIGYGVQLRTYSRGRPYVHLDKVTPADAGRRDWPDGRAPRQDWAVIPWVPIEHPEDATLKWVNLAKGEQLGELALAVREANRESFLRDLFVDTELDDLAELVGGGGEDPAAALLATIAEADPELIDELYTAHAELWGDEHTLAAQKRILVITIEELLDADGLDALYAGNRDIWGPEHDAAATKAYQRLTGRG